MPNQDNLFLNTWLEKWIHIPEKIKLREKSLDKTFTH